MLYKNFEISQSQELDNSAFSATRSNVRTLNGRKRSPDGSGWNGGLEPKVRDAALCSNWSNLAVIRHCYSDEIVGSRRLNFD